MKEGWNSKTIGQLCSEGGGKVQTGPFGSQLHQSDYSDEGTPVVMPADIPTGQIDVSRIARVSEAHVHRLSRHQLQKGDIVYGRRGDIGRQALVRDKNVGWLCGTGCLRIRLGKSDVDAEYLHRYLTMPEIIGWIEGQAIGATMPNLNTNILNRVPVYYPAWEEQRKIAAILTAYDDLIETNKRRIALLEKMAEELYREWFVRMRFPGYKEAKFVKGVPEGWTIRPIGELCSTVTDGSHFSPPFVEGGKPMASVKDMHTYGFDMTSVKTISDANFEILKKGDCQPLTNDVLIAKDGSYLKHVFVWGEDYEIAILSSIAILRPNLNEIKPHFFAQVLRQPSTKSMMSGYVSGSALPRIILQDFKKMKLLIPTSDLMDNYEDSAVTTFRQIRGLLKINENLTQTRDLLLPRLISGKLSVEELDIQFPPSMGAEGFPN